MICQNFNFFNYHLSQLLYVSIVFCTNYNSFQLQSGASSHAKHGGAYFSAVRGSIKDPIAVPGRDEVQEC